MCGVFTMFARVNISMLARLYFKVIHGVPLAGHTLLNENQEHLMSTRQQSPAREMARLVWSASLAVSIGTLCYPDSHVLLQSCN